MAGKKGKGKSNENDKDLDMTDKQNNDQEYEDKGRKKLDQIDGEFELTELEEITDSEYSKLSGPHKKLANNCTIVMENLTRMKNCMALVKDCHNNMVTNVDINTEICTQLDIEMGNLSGHVAAVDKTVSGIESGMMRIKQDVENTKFSITNLDKDTRKRNLVVNGLTEQPGEDLLERTSNVFKKIYPDFHTDNIDCIYRVGKYMEKKTREVVVELFSHYIKDQILAKRNELKNFPEYRVVWVNEDLPAKIRQNRGTMREITRQAKSMDIECSTSGDKITCKGITYSPQQLPAMPVGLRPDDLMTKTVGNRIGFMSERSYMSNFFMCPVTIDGYTFASSEHAIQYKKSIVLKREDVGYLIKQQPSALDAKRLGDKLQHSPEWDKVKKQMVSEIAKQKFRENEDLHDKLIRTTGYELQEASFDGYWGLGTPVYSKEFQQGKYKGQNIFGKILSNIRDEMAGVSKDEVKKPEGEDEDLVDDDEVKRKKNEELGKFMGDLDQGALKVLMEGIMKVQGRSELQDKLKKKIDSL